MTQTYSTPPAIRAIAAPAARPAPKPAPQLPTRPGPLDLMYGYYDIEPAI